MEDAILYMVALVCALAGLICLFFVTTPQSDGYTITAKINSVHGNSAQASVQTTLIGKNLKVGEEVCGTAFWSENAFVLTKNNPCYP